MTQTMTLKEAKAKKEEKRLYALHYQRRVRAAAKAEEADRASITDEIDFEAYRASGGVIGIPNSRCRYCTSPAVNNCCPTCETVRCSFGKCRGVPTVRCSHKRCDEGRCDEGLCGG